MHVVGISYLHANSRHSQAPCSARRARSTHCPPATLANATFPMLPDPEPKDDVDGIDADEDVCEDTEAGNEENGGSGRSLLLPPDADSDSSTSIRKPPTLLDLARRAKVLNMCDRYMSRRQAMMVGMKMKASCTAREHRAAVSRTDSEKERGAAAAA